MNENPYLPRIAEIVSIKKVGKGEKLFEFRLVDGCGLDYIPGQFVEISIFGIGEAPISISSSPNKKDSFELAVRSAGNVTGALHKLDIGDQVGIRGALGKGFPMGHLRGRDLIFVAGGIGLFPLRSLMNYCINNRESFGKIIIMVGAKTPSDRVFVEELEDISKRDDVELYETVDICDDEWKGNVGVITTLFSKINPDPANTTAVVVGPPCMYKFVAAEVKKHNIPDDEILMSLERRMKCGIGKCGHCQIGDKYVCKDGPVFKYSELKNMIGAL